MQYPIPQFVEIEDKVVGPLTLRQFFYLMAGGIFLVAAYSFADLELFILLAVLTVIVIGPLAFLKVNGRPFQYFALAAFNFFTKPHVRLWAKDTKATPIIFNKGPEEKRRLPVGERKLNRSQLRDLAISLDTKEVYSDKNKVNAQEPKAIDY